MVMLGPWGPVRGDPRCSMAAVLLVAACLLASNFVGIVRGDFGEAVMYEAVDLSEAHPADAEEHVRSMESLLHWAIANSDHEELAKRADGVRKEELLQELTQELEQRRARVKELKAYMDDQVTETQLIKDCLAVLTSGNASAPDRLQALQELQPLVEPIDNANDLKPLGGIPPVVEHLLATSAAAGFPATPAEFNSLRAAAAFVVGTAASNNIKFQSDLMEAVPDIFNRLIELSLYAAEEVALKGMYALGAMVRNLQQANQAFGQAGGYRALEQLMSSGEVGVRVKRKALALMMDLTQFTHSQGESSSAQPLVRLTSQKGLLTATLELIGAGDMDMVEKALETLLSLLQGQARLEAAETLREAGAGSRLSALEVQLLQDQVDDDDSYLDYLVQQCRKAQKLLEHGASAEPQKSVGSQHSASPDGTPAQGSNAGKSGDAEPVLQLGHTEL